MRHDEVGVFRSMNLKGCRCYDTIKVHGRWVILTVYSSKFEVSTARPCASGRLSQIQTCFREEMKPSSCRGECILK